jgi:hypothetical protein
MKSSRSSRTEAGRRPAAHRPHDPAEVREREEALLRMFNEASPDLTGEDVEELESLLGAFAGNE